MRTIAAGAGYFRHGPAEVASSCRTGDEPVSASGSRWMIATRRLQLGARRNLPILSATFATKSANIRLSKVDRLVRFVAASDIHASRTTNSRHGAGNEDTFQSARHRRTRLNICAKQSSNAIFRAMALSRVAANLAGRQRNASRAHLTYSATASLELAALLIELGPAMKRSCRLHFVSCANAVALRGATPVSGYPLRHDQCRPHISGGRDYAQDPCNHCCPLRWVP